MSVYPSALARIARGNFNWEHTPVEALLVSTASVYDRNHSLVSDIQGELSDGTRVKLTGKSVTDDGVSRVVYNSDNAVFSSQVAGQSVGACIIYEAGTGALIAFVEGSTVPTDGANVTVSFPSGVFGLSYA